MEAIPAYAQQQLNNLIEQCKKRYGSYPDFRGKRTTYVGTVKRKLSNDLAYSVCVVVLVLFVFCAITGFYTLVRWVM